MKTPTPTRVSSGNWFLRLRLGGEAIYVTAATKTECIRQAELIKAEHRAGKRKSAGGLPTLYNTVKRYIDSRAAVLSPSTVKAYTSVLEHRFPRFRDLPVSVIRDWQALINNEVAQGVSPKTVKNTWSLIAAALEFSGAEVPTVKLPQIAPAVRPWLDDDQIRVFVAAVHGQPCEIPALLALHSLRRSEILALTWDRVDLRNRIIRVEGAAVYDVSGHLVQKKTNKTRNSFRRVPIMIPELLEALSAVPEDLRTGSVVSCYPNTIYSQINKLCRREGLPEVGVHGLRHSFASLAHHVGMPEQEAMLIGGWEDAQTMHRIYEHVSAADRLRSENLMQKFFENGN